jgi:hypothetical protein
LEPSAFAALMRQASLFAGAAGRTIATQLDPVRVTRVPAAA